MGWGEFISEINIKGTAMSANYLTTVKPNFQARYILLDWISKIKEARTLLSDY
jgi:hypothetical protein